jgi:anaerobic ribonucleoside-triphosphate reductase
MGSNNSKNCHGCGIAMEEASRKTRKAWCPNSDRHDNVEKEKDIKTSLLNFIEREKKSLCGHVWALFQGPAV